MNYKVIHETCFLRDYYLGQGKIFSVDGIHFFIYMCIYIHIYICLYILLLCRSLHDFEGPNKTQVCQLGRSFPPVSPVLSSAVAGRFVVLWSLGFFCFCFCFVLPFRMSVFEVVNKCTDI